MTTVTAVANTGSTNVFDSTVLQAITSGVLGTHSSTQFAFSNDFFALVGHGSGLSYSNGHPSGGTLTSLEFQLSTGVSDWSGLSVSVSALWSAISSGNVTAFNNLFFSGNDTFNMQASNGQDNLAGGAGDDTFNYAGNLSSSTVIDGGSGTNTLNLAGDYSTNGFNAFQSVTNIQTLHLGAGHFYDITMAPTAALTVDASALGVNDSANFHATAATTAAITFTGGAGNDSFQGGAGNDTFNGGAGNDTIDCSRATAGLTIDLNQTTVHGAGIGTDTINSVENAVGTQYNDAFIGTSGDNTFFAAPANGFPGVAVGVDTFDGGAGNDTVSFSGFSGPGLTIDLRSGSPHIAGTDTFTSIENAVGSQYDDTFYGNSADNVFDGGSDYDHDTIDYSSATGGMTITMTKFTTVASGIDTAMTATGGGQGTDTLLNIEHIIGSNHGDTFNLLAGLVNSNTSAAVVIDGGDGSDTISFANATTNISAYLSEMGTSIEHMVGSAFDDWMVAGPDAATIDGGAGDDTLQGGTGGDALNGGDGKDAISGEQGNDVVNGGAGDDVLSGGGTYADFNNDTGDDTLNGGDGNDTLYSGDQFDLNSGGNSTLDGGAGDDNLNGGPGSDTASYADATGGVTVSLNVVGEQNVGGGAGKDTLYNIENLIGSNFDDSLTSGGVPNILSGLGGNDTLDISKYDGPNYVNGQPGHDTALGGHGNDTIVGGSVFAANDTVDGGADYDTLSLAGDYSAGLTFAATTMVNVEEIDLASGHDYKLALDDANVTAGKTLTLAAAGLLSGDTVTFNGGNETDGAFVLNTGAGADSLTAGAGNDTINSGAGDDVVDLTRGGNDTVNASDGNDKILMGATLTARDALNGGSGSDTVVLDGDYSGGVTFGATTLVNVETLQLTAGHAYSLVTNDANVAAGQTLAVDGSALGASDALTFDGSHELSGSFAVTGGAAGDTLTGGAGSDTLTGNAGNDTLDMSAGGSDSAFGGSGNDTFLFRGALDSLDTINGGANNDTVVLQGDYSAGLTFGANAFTSVEILSFIAHHSYNLTTNDGNVAAGGTLTLQAKPLLDSDTLIFNGSAETNGAFNVIGGRGNDTITGGAGNDVLSGRGGADHLTGGAGADHYVYTQVSDSTGPTFDTVTGFDANADAFDLPFLVKHFNAPVTGALSAASFDTDLASALGTGQLGGHHALLFTASSGTYTGDTFLVVDMNNVAGYQAGHDLVVMLDQAANLPSLSTADFI